MPRAYVLALLATLIVPSMADARPTLGRLQEIARRSLESNIIQVDSGPYLAAGGHQFHSLWTRDFAFAARGLLRLRRFDVVRNQLDALLRAARPEDGLVPRTLDSRPIALRVTLSTLATMVGLRSSLSIGDRLRPQYLDEHGSPAIDSNLLVLLTAIDYVRASGDHAWWRKVEPDLVRVFRFYEAHLKGGLLWQPAYSDWQDSVKREGHAFYTNLLYHQVARRLLEHPAFGVKPAAVEQLGRRIERTFFDPAQGLFRSLAGQPYVSLDGNLLAIDLGFFQDPRRDRALYQALTRSELWTRHGLPGFATAPDYPRSWAHRPARLVGLTHYHGEIFWSWLMALSAKVAHQVGDHPTARRVLRTLGQNARRDGAVTEIYAPKPGLPAFRSWLYASETPFSWGAGMVLDAISAVKGGRGAAAPAASGTTRASSPRGSARLRP